MQKLFTTPKHELKSKKFPADLSLEGDGFQDVNILEEDTTDIHTKVGSKGKTPMKKDAKLKETPDKILGPIELSGSDSDNQPSTSAGVSHRKKRNVTSTKQNELIEVMTKAFRRDIETEDKSDITKADDISIFLEHIGRQLRALKDSAQVSIMQNCIQMAVFKCQMTFIKEPKAALVVIPDDDSDTLDMWTPLNVSTPKAAPITTSGKVARPKVHTVKESMGDRPKEAVDKHDVQYKSAGTPTSIGVARPVAEPKSVAAGQEKEGPSGSVPPKKQHSKGKNSGMGRKTSTGLSKMTTRRTTRQNKYSSQEESLLVKPLLLDDNSPDDNNLPDLP